MLVKKVYENHGAVVSIKKKLPNLEREKIRAQLEQENKRYWEELHVYMVLHLTPSLWSFWFRILSSPSTSTFLEVYVLFKKYVYGIFR